MSNEPEVWLRGPLADFPELLQPVAYALLQAREEVSELMSGFPEALLWERPAGLASPGFHLQHLAGVLDRLFTYAAARPLLTEQLTTLKAEGKPFEQEAIISHLLDKFNKQVDAAILILKHTDEDVLKEARAVGRSMMPSTVIGLYMHAAEHTMRHSGQLLVTVKILADNFSGETDSRLIT